MITSEVIPSEGVVVVPVTVSASFFRFELATGNEGIKTITEPLLNTEEKAKQRAISEFLENGYIHRNISFSTYRTDFKLLDIIEVYGLTYKIINIDLSSDLTKTIINISGLRYE